MTNTRKEVLGIPAPERAYDSKYYDKNCPFTGGLAVKKELLTGRVVKKDTNKSATIEWFSSHYVPKYERFELRKSRLRVHNPPCLDAQIGQSVLVAKSRPISKTKHHVIIQVLEGGKVEHHFGAEEPGKKIVKSSHSVHDVTKGTKKETADENGEEE
ncbi:30S ribosomal protein S17 [Candidatus Woesearchaeota archaeon]|nr:30S ribosomal protein S17 [Candidatus Woesearchaeota archaeon]MBI2581798.1 30S ribosomal protein S17 [Candidatus Woesearchaeota archaeon]